MSKSILEQQQGFTLVELVAVIVLLGVLTVTVAPRFMGTDTFSQFAARDQILSAYRYAQQRSMLDRSGSCYQLLIDSTGFGPQRDGDFFGPVKQVLFTGDYSQISVTATAIYFDGLGNALSDSTACNSDIISSPISITISSAGSPSIVLEVFPSGYARAI
ncbi:MAG: type II secretion system protein [Spongiibacteraceae bacterium]|nr:type II secretion system protein [Spongiibacteraceae bacterium]